ncbi:hypothetical protein [Bacillus canaveralius]|uniref:hypothetical protein n=1 Tax=Bacillus canaveralius TaxID=1403243 RepID=UPI000F79683B|nr:hypothetical protein [Bacillus canaveralius]RSK55649.1 hypothetical protein EJA13_03185 [Bacillus canaveralius]
MIEHNDNNNQLQKELKSAWSELDIFNNLLKMELKGSSHLQLPTMFQIVYYLSFSSQKFVSLLHSKKGERYRG